MSEKTPRSEPKKHITFADAQDQVLDFFDQRPEVAAFFPDIIQEIIDKPITKTATPVANSLRGRRVGALIQKPPRIIRDSPKSPPTSEKVVIEHPDMGGNT